MAVKIKVESGSLSLGLGLMGVGAFVVTPSEFASYIGWAFIIAGLFALIWDIKFEHGHFRTQPIRSLGSRMTTMGPQILMFAGGTTFLIGLVWHLQRTFAPGKTSIATTTVSSQPAPTLDVQNPFSGLTADEIAVRQGIWRGLRTDCIDPITNVYNEGTRFRDTWAELLRTEKPGGLVAKLATFKSMLLVAVGRLSERRKQHAAYAELVATLEFDARELSGATDALSRAVEVLPPGASYDDTNGIPLAVGNFTRALKNMHAWIESAEADRTRYVKLLDDADQR